MAAELISESLGISSYLSAQAINHRFVGFISYCLAEGFVYTLSHSKIKGVNALTAKHIILIALNGNAGQRSIGTNGIWLPQEAMTCGEATVEQLQQIYLTAVQGNQGEILIMDMNEIIFVCLGKFLWQHIVVNKMLGTLGAQLQHNAHRGISVDIGVVPLHIGINSIGKENILVALHQVFLSFTALCMALAVHNVVLGHIEEALLHQHLLYYILYFFYGNTAKVGNGILNLAGNTFLFLISHAVRYFLGSSGNGIIDFGTVIVYSKARPFNNVF